LMYKIKLARTIWMEYYSISKITYSFLKNFVK